MSSAHSSTAAAAAAWLYERKGWLAAGAGVGLAAWQLYTLSDEKHTDVPAAPVLPVGVGAGIGVATAAAAAPSAFASASASLSDPDPSLFPHLFPSASVSGLLLHRRQWLVSNPRAVVFVLHGYAEHSGRYEAVAARLNAAGCSVYSFDHQGHGRSGGDRAHVESFDHYVADALHYIERVQSGFDAPLPCFLLGHSMGGLVATQVMHASYVDAEPKDGDAHAVDAAAAVDAASASASNAATAASADITAAGVPAVPATGGAEVTALQRQWRGRLWPWSGCILSAPALAPNPKDATPMLVAVSRWLSDTFPKMQTIGLDVSGVSRDASVVEQYKADPLNYHGRMRARWAYEMLRTMRLAASDAQMQAARWPVLVLQGDADRLVHAPGATLFFERAASPDKTFRSFPGGYHELVHDSLSRDEALDTVATWIADRCDGQRARRDSKQFP